ncbi:MAG: outer membrane protein [Bacteroidetes bacterium]|jgi:tetratricopeptide (TPR) repeat protein|nr:outer membrane protein [Bacteroidota bacterium]
MNQHMKKLSYLSTLLLMLTVNLTFAQDENKKADPHEADNKFLSGNYEAALDEYLLLLEKDAKNDKHNYNIAICYLNTNINKAKAIPYLEILTHKPKFDPNAMYLLGRAYHYANRFDDAIRSFNSFKQTGRGNADNLADVDRQVQFCINAKELIKFPLNVTFENLGNNVNSPYADYFPFVPSDESFLTYNSRRPDDGSALAKEDGTYPAGIYISKVTDGAFAKAKNIGPPISKKEGEQEIIGLSASGEIMLLYYTNLKGVGDIYITTTDKNKSFKPADKLAENINSAKAEEIAACISNDGNMLYFASNRVGGLGGTDLYLSKKMPNGTWSAAQNMGPEINTPFDEDFPNVTNDGKALYFSSNGHTSMGGYDIFKAEMNETTHQFSNPKNVGFPINTTEDNFNFRLSNNGRFGYMAALRPGGAGDLDIYRVTFNEIEPQYSVIKGDVRSADSTQHLNFSDVFISVTNTKTQEIIGNYLPNPNTGKYVMVLAPGNYEMSIEANGFQSANDKIAILDKGSYKFEITRDIDLKPEGYQNR